MYLGDKDLDGAVVSLARLWAGHDEGGQYPWHDETTPFRVPVPRPPLDWRGPSRDWPACPSARVTIGQLFGTILRLAARIEEQRLRAARDAAWFALRQEDGNAYAGHERRLAHCEADYRDTCRNLGRFYEDQKRGAG
jgi:hypothetical protein